MLIVSVKLLKDRMLMSGSKFFDIKFLDFCTEFSNLSAARRIGFGDGDTANRLRTSDGLRPQVSVPALRSALPGRIQSKRFLMLEAVPLPGLCPDDLSGELARYRSDFGFGPQQTLPHGLSRSSRSQQLGLHQRNERLANLC